jgi:hypothetical protein
MPIENRELAAGTRLVARYKKRRRAPPSDRTSTRKTQQPSVRHDRQEASSPGNRGRVIFYDADISGEPQLPMAPAGLTPNANH